MEEEASVGVVELRGHPGRQAPTAATDHLLEHRPQERAALPSGLLRTDIARAALKEEKALLAVAAKAAEVAGAAELTSATRA